MVKIKAQSLPREFDIIKTGRGYTMHGWDFTREELAAAINDHRMLNPAFELGTNFCPWNCEFCFTEEPGHPDGEKRRLANEMSLDDRLNLIEAAAQLGARTINFVGAGEPTIDPNFWTLVEHMRANNITPIIYTEGALQLTKPEFVLRLYEIGATVVLKVNSLENEAYQNAIVAGPKDRKRPNSGNYTKLRNEAIDLLLQAGFADCDPTRLAFDTIVSRENVREVPDIHRYARSHNIFVLFVNYLPSGRSTDVLHNALTRSEQFELFGRLAKMDEVEYGIIHDSKFPYAGGTPCSIRGLGLYVKITGKVFDCPGELVELGNIRNQSLQSVWQSARPITQSFNGGCAPRENFWSNHPDMKGKLLPIIQ